MPPPDDALRHRPSQRRGSRFRDLVDKHVLPQVRQGTLNERAAATRKFLAATDVEGARKLSRWQYHAQRIAFWLVVLLIFYHGFLKHLLWQLKQINKMYSLVHGVQSADHQEFAVWVYKICTREPWHAETILCQSLDDRNWLARQLLLIKLADRDVDHCDPMLGDKSGCRYEPCMKEGLPELLTGIAKENGPLLSMLGKTPILGVRIVEPVRRILHSIANGTMPFSKLQRELDVIFFGDGVSGGGKGIASLLARMRGGAAGSEVVHERHVRDYLFNKFVFPFLKTWGVVIGGRRDVEMGALAAQVRVR